METLSTLHIFMVLALLLPLLSCVVCLIIPDRYAWLVSLIASLLLLLSAIASIYLLFSTRESIVLTIPINWFQVGNYTFNLSLEFNSLSRIMVPLVSVISWLVHVYSIGYMAGDKGIRRYFAMLGFFTFSMLGIVLADNLLVLFLFWELVGFSSYMLIGHWLERPAAAKAAQKAFLFNRIGDAGFLIGILIIGADMQTLSLNNLLHHTETFSWQTAATLFIFCGVIGKSAQFPLFTWLPDAMEGPTPVSALIHAATMVAAGVFLLARVFPLFTETSLIVVALIGTVTALIAAICALFQYDLKKILAYSTLSQLGLMVMAMGAGANQAAILHLITHAFFKAGLFLAAGSVIHSLHQAQQQAHNHFDAQDIRNLGGLKQSLPVTSIVFVICGASLAGIPLFSGFLSKEAILTELVQWTGSQLSWKWIVLGSFFLVSFLTVLYTFRMIWFLFFGEKKIDATVSESPVIMRLPMMVMAVASIWLVAGANPLQPSSSFIISLNDIHHSSAITIFSIFWVGIAGLAAWLVLVKQKVQRSSDFLRSGFGVDRVYTYIFERPALAISQFTAWADRKSIDGALHFVAYIQVSIAHAIAWADKNIIDGSVNALAWLAGLVGTFTRSFQSGKIQLYIFWAMMGLIIFLLFILI